MRKSTFLWCVMAVFCGTSLYHTSQKVHDGREELKQLTKEVAREEETIRVLATEWSYLNQPARLEILAKKYLPLAQMKGSQFMTADELPLRGEVAAEPKAEPVIVSDTSSPRRRGSIGAERKMDSRFRGNDEGGAKQRTADRNLGDVIRGLGVN